MRWIRHKLPWILGLLLLTGSLLGANHLARTGEGNGRDRGAVATGNRNHKNGSVVVQGIVAPINELTPLAPSVTGEVIEVLVRNEQTVKKGDPLLRLDPALALDTLQEADDGIAAAEAQVREAQTAVEKIKLERLGQKLKVDAKRREYEANKILLAAAEKKLNDGLSFGTKEEIDAKRQLLKAQEIGIEAEELILKIYDVSIPDYKVDQAKAGLNRAKTLRNKAQRGVDACVMKAPADGVIVRSYVGIGSKFGPQIQQPAFLFYTGGLTVRAEVDQEWASRVLEGQDAIVYDYSNSEQKWHGRVTFVANSFLPRRDTAMLPDVFQQNQDRVLEARITLDSGQPPPRLNQKVRIHIGAN